MCNFFSFVTTVDNGKSKYYYFNSEERKEMIKNNRGVYIDSHSVIASDKGIDPDKCNKYEYNPLTRKFTIDQINCEDDSDRAKNWIKRLDFKKVVPELVIKKIINPFKDFPKSKKPTKQDIENLKKWIDVRDSVKDSIKDSVRDSVRDSVWDSIWDLVRDSIWYSVWDLVRDSVRDLVRDSVKDSVRDSVRDSVWDSVYGYFSSFFKINYEQDYSCIVELWERGFVPSFNEKIWRLHSGKDAKVVYEHK